MLLGHKPQPRARFPLPQERALSLWIGCGAIRGGDRGDMKQLLSDLAAMAEPGFWIALGLLALPYVVGVIFLIKTCHCL